MSMEHCWNKDKKMKYLEESMVHYHSAHHKSHMDCLGIKLWHLK